MRRLAEPAPAMVALIVESLRRGNRREVAAAAAGIAPRVLSRWVSRGEAEDTGPLHDFAIRVLAAEAEAENAALDIIRKAGKHSWQAAAWYLERTRQETYAVRTRIDLKTEAMARAAAMTDEELEARKRELAALLQRELVDESEDRRARKRGDSS